MLRESVKRAAAWRDQGVHVSIAVNISVDDLVDEYLPYYLLDLVKQHGLTPAQVTLEVTESAMMHNVHKSLAVVNCIHELGFRISVDDFGTGQSALAQLKRLPVDELKIDKSFVLGMQDRKDEAIVRATIDLAHQLGLTRRGGGRRERRSAGAARGVRLRVRSGIPHRQAARAARFARVARAVAGRQGGRRRAVRGARYRAASPRVSRRGGSAPSIGISNVGFRS